MNPPILFRTHFIQPWVRKCSFSSAERTGVDVMVKEQCGCRENKLKRVLGLETR
jgi:hypothetical protein